MGQAQSYDLRNQNNEDDPWWQQSQSREIFEYRNATSELVEESNLQNNETIEADANTQQSGYSRSLDSREKLEIFKKHLEEKRLERQAIISAKKREMDQLRTDLEQQKIENKILSEKLKEFVKHSTNLNNETSDAIFQPDMEGMIKENEILKSKLHSLLDEKQTTENILMKNKELQIEQASLQHELQSLNKQISDSEQQKEEYIKHIAALKDIIKISKQMILIREGELKELKQKLTLIENTLADREAHVMSNDLREEYERQLRNIRNLRTLYEERTRISRIELQNVKDQLTDTQQKLDIETTKTSELEQRITDLESDVSSKYDNINNLESNLGFSKAECRGLKHEMAVINQLFAQFLLGFNSPTQDVNLDKLVQLLEENHDLLTDITVKDDTDETALPRLLLHLVNQTDKSEETENGEDLQQEQNAIAESEKNEIKINENVDTGQYINPSNQFNSPEEIVTNLPKVWRVLTELLSHQAVQPVEIDETCTTPTTDASNPCYKSVETPAGTRYVLSVSKTYIRLKDLILEKKYLQKEMLKMKTLNTRLEDRLHEQESRLHVVSKELSKTWHIVGRLQRQHEQLHTNEKILCYELRQKRKMLNELKEELEYCKGKWKSAREKNRESEHECHKLRSEFASRRTMAIIIESGNNSAESGYSDEQEELDSEEDDLEDTEAAQNRKALEERLFITNINSKLSEGGNPENICGIPSVSEDCSVLQTENINIEISSPTSDAESTIPENIDCSNNNETINVLSTLDSTADTIVTVLSDQEFSESQSREQNSHPGSNDRDSQCDIFNAVSSEGAISGDNLRLKNTHVHFDENVDVFNTNNDSASSDVPVLSQGVANNAEDSCPISRARESIIKSENVAKTREEKFKRLEEHCQQLKQTYTNQTQRGTDLSSRLDNLHQQFGSTDQTPSTSADTHVEEETSSTIVTQDTKPTLKTDAEREERFKRLEDQCKQLKQKYSKQTKMGTELCSKLDNMHQQFAGPSRDTAANIGDGSSDPIDESVTSSSITDMNLSEENEEVPLNNEPSTTNKDEN